MRIDFFLPGFAARAAVRATDSVADFFNETTEASPRQKKQKRRHRKNSKGIKSAT
jgi:hypothetical protein